MADTKTETSADELRLAAKRLRCSHRFPCNPPDGSLWAPGPCAHCGMPWTGEDPIPTVLQDPLASWLESSAWVARRHPQNPDYAGLPDTKFCTTCQDEETTCVAFVDGALAVARALNAGVAPAREEPRRPPAQSLTREPAT